MATGIAGASLRQMVLGTTVRRAAALLPQTATAAIFNVVGGKVLITSLIGEVVVAMPATVNTVALNGTPTSGTQVIWNTATATTSKEAGSIITLNPATGSALIVTNAGAGAVIDPTGYIAQIGTVTLTTTASAATGTVKWSLTYIPIDDGASVTAA